MAIREVVRRLRAFEKGKPLPRFETIHTHLSGNAMFVAFVRMSGETRPWGVVFGHADEEPTILTVLDGRNRVEIGEMMDQFGRALLRHFRAESASFDPIVKEELPIADAPQLWVPGPSHVDMVHYLGYTFWRTRADDMDDSILGQLSRFCGWLFRERAMPGQQIFFDATEAVKQAFVFPTDDYSLTHLGAQEAWLNRRGSYESRLTDARESAKAWQGITLNTEIEEELSDLLAAYRDEEKMNPGTEKSQKYASRVREILEGELRRRWDNAVRAFEVLKSDPRGENIGLPRLVEDSLRRFVFDFQRMELRIADPELGPAFTPHPETDHHGSAAASRYFQMNAADSRASTILVHDDSELLRELLSAGRAIRARITEVQVERQGNATNIEWRMTVPLNDEFRMRSGESLTPLGSIGHTIKVTSVELLDNDTAEVCGLWFARKTIDIQSGIGEKPASQSWIGETLVLVPADSSELQMKASRDVWDARDGAGAWLTHSRVGGTIGGDKDDVTQIEGK